MTISTPPPVACGYVRGSTDQQVDTLNRLDVADDDLLQSDEQDFTS
jgi:hypothetical protein